jgi:hypothetical protein
MRIPLSSAIAGALLSFAVAASPAAANSPFVPAGSSPATVTQPGPVEFRYTVQGKSEASSTSFQPSGLRLQAGAFHGAITTALVTAVRAEGATLTPEAMSMASLAPTCNRGAVVEASWTRYRLDVPAEAVATVVVTANVPAGVPSAKVGVQISSGLLGIPGQPVPAIAFTSAQTVERTAYVDGVSLKVKKAKGGKYRVSGRVQPARRGEKLSFVSRLAASKGDVDSLFGQPESVYLPLASLSTVGTAKTGKGGKYSALLKLKPGTAVAARTAGERRGASCGVFIG